jgi:hypothetical protein
MRPQEAEPSEPPAAEADEDGAADLLAAFARQSLGPGGASAATPAETQKQAKGKAKAAAAPAPQPAGGCRGVNLLSWQQSCCMRSQALSMLGMPV